MGLGLFLGRAVLERLGGTLEFEVERDVTRAVLRLPAAAEGRVPTVTPRLANASPARLE
jgi:hypothetical protein